MRCESSKYLRKKEINCLKLSEINRSSSSNSSRKIKGIESRKKCSSCLRFFFNRNQQKYEINSIEWRLEIDLWSDDRSAFLTSQNMLFRSKLKIGSFNSSIWQWNFDWIKINVMEWKFQRWFLFFIQKLTKKIIFLIDSKKTCI